MKLPEEKKKFLELIEKGASVTKACQMINIHRSTFYDWRDQDIKFAESFIRARTICHDETCDAASFFYHKWVCEGDKKMVTKWLDQQHPEFARKTFNILIRRDGSLDQDLVHMDKDELFTFIRAYEHSGFKVTDLLEEKMQNDYKEWYIQNNEGPPILPDDPVRDFVHQKIMEGLEKKRRADETTS